MVLSMKSAATNTLTGVPIVFGEYEAVLSAAASVTGTAVALKVTITTNTVTVIPASDPGGTGETYYVLADCM